MILFYYSRFAIFLVVFSSFIFVAFAASSNYRPIKGLEAKETKLEDENTREIKVKKVERSETSGRGSDNYKFSNQDICLFNYCNYITVSYSKAFQNKVSGDSFKSIEDLSADPFSGLHYGLDIFYGRNFRSLINLSIEFGLTYDLAYFDAISVHTTQQGPEAVMNYGIHSIAPSIRLVYDIFPKDLFSVYGGLEVGVSISDFVFSNQYDVKFKPKIGGIVGISYRLDRARSAELFLGYRGFYIPKTTFTILEKEYELSFSGHNIQAGLRYKF